MVGWKRALGCSQPCAEPADFSAGGTGGGEGEGGPLEPLPRRLPAVLWTRGWGWKAGLQSVMIPFPRCWLPTRQLVSVSRSSPTVGKGSSAVLGVESQGLQRKGSPGNRAQFPGNASALPKGRRSPLWRRALRDGPVVLHPCLSP